MSFQRELLEWKNKYGSRIAIQEMCGTSKSYEDLYTDMLTYAKWFWKDNHKRIAIMGQTSYKWMCNGYGAIIAGKTVVAVDPLLPVDDIVTLLKNMDVEAVFTDEEDKKLRKAIEEAGIVYHAYLKEEELNDGLLEEESKDGDIIVFTSGTSGKAKGVVVPFQDVCDNSAVLMEDIAAGVDGNMYTPLPLYHMYATVCVLAYLYKGKTVYLGNPRKIIEELAHFKPAVMVVVSAMVEFLLKNNAVGDWAKVFTVAGAKCDKSLELKTSEYGIRLQNIYGASEIAGVIALNSLDRGIERLAPLKDVEVTLEDEGEIAIKAPFHLTEYYKNPEATNEVMRNGKIYLGDIGEAFEDGTFSPLGRKKDMIAMSNGNKLYCDEMDEELTAIDGVEEACVIYSCGKIIAVVVCAADAEEDAVKKSLKQYNKKQPYFRKIDGIWMRKEPLPRAGLGKLKRNVVLNEYEAGEM